MAHIGPFFVPKAYRVKGENFLVISLFLGDDHVADDVEGVLEVINNKQKTTDSKAQIFWDAVLEYTVNKHPMEIYLEDLIRGGWSLIWLTTNEFNSNLTPFPEKEKSVFPN